MVKIDSTQKLDFNNVLITPKRSTLNSRKEVNLQRSFIFSHGQTWNGLPIMTANMTSTGTLDVYKEVVQYKMLTCLHKFYNKNHFEQYNRLSLKII